MTARQIVVDEAILVGSFSLAAVVISWLGRRGDLRDLRDAERARRALGRVVRPFDFEEGS